jgi:transcriptional regulator with XRE-family HTH domain
MLSTDIPHRLKALREAAGLSIRSLAEKLGMSSSGYAHYETPARFKDQYLPMELALNLARVLAPRGVLADQVMALARGAAAPQTRNGVASGFSEDAAQPWSPASGQKSAVEAVVRALAPGAVNPGTFRMTRAIHLLGLLPGDILIVDRKRLPHAGELALANEQREDGHMVTVVGRYLPPLLYTAESLSEGRVLDVTSGTVAVYHPILASFRAAPAAAAATAA